MTIRGGRGQTRRDPQNAVVDLLAERGLGRREACLGVDQGLRPVGPGDVDAARIDVDDDRAHRGLSGLEEDRSPSRGYLAGPVGQPEVLRADLGPLGGLLLAAVLSVAGPVRWRPAVR